MASRLHRVRAMGRFFLSGQTTCALLLGAGLLLRAHSALRPDEPAQRAPRARPAEMFPERTPPAIEPAPRAVKGASERDGKMARTGKARSHARKVSGHRPRRADAGPTVGGAGSSRDGRRQQAGVLAGRCGSGLAQMRFGCG